MLCDLWSFPATVSSVERPQLRKLFPQFAKKDLLTTGCFVVALSNTLSLSEFTHKLSGEANKVVWKLKNEGEESQAGQDPSRKHQADKVWTRVELEISSG